MFDYPACERHDHLDPFGRCYSCGRMVQDESLKETPPTDRDARFAWEMRRIEMNKPELEILLDAASCAALDRWIDGMPDWSDQWDRRRSVPCGELLEEQCLDEAWRMLGNPLLTGQALQNVEQILAMEFPEYRP